MLNTEICKSDNWRCAVELSSRAGSRGSCTAPGLQHSVCCVMETPAFNCGCKTLITECVWVCVCVSYNPPRVPAPQMMRDVSAPACRGVGSLRVCLILGWKARVLLGLSVREGLYQLHLHTLSGAWICLGLCMGPWSQLPHTSLLLCPLLQVLPEPDALGSGASWSHRKLWSFGHFQSTALMLTAVSKVVVRPPS